MNRSLGLATAAVPALAAFFGVLTLRSADRSLHPLSGSSEMVRGLSGSAALARLAPPRRQAEAAPARHSHEVKGNEALSPLPPVEEAIVRYPFAPKAARIRLARSVVRAKAISAFGPRHGMGWAQPDAEYWRRIPPEARDIPRNWSNLPAVRFTNTEIGGVREVRLRRGPGYDQWLLRDPLHHLTACISVQRATRRVYFMQVARRRGGSWGLAIADDQCYSCHPSGPRVIRPLNEPRVDPRVLAQFNRRMLSYAACDFADSVDAGLRSESPLGPGCTRCHDGVRRGRLYAIHQRPIRFKAGREQTMPPDTEGTPGTG